MNEIHVLYMEDDEGIARLLQKRLHRLQYEVDIVTNGHEGLRRFAEDNHDVILIDYHMPGMNGLEVIRQLPKQEDPPAVIMLTGSGNEKIAVEALKLGATDYVVKDVDGTYIDLLPTVIEQSLRQRQLVKANRLAEAALERSEKYFRALIENSLDLIALTDKEGVIRYISPSARQIFGFADIDLIGENGLKLIMPGDSTVLDQSFYANAVAFYGALLEQPGQVVMTELRTQDRKGVWRWLEVRGRNLLHEPWIESMVFNIRDISERKHAEAALSESEHRFRTLFELAPDAYAIVDLEGRILDCNQATINLTGFSREELVNQTVVEAGVFSAGVMDGLRADYPNPQSLTSSFDIELSLRRPTGEDVVADIRAVPITISGAERIFAVGRDITWRKQVETQLRTHNEQLRILSQVDDELTRKLDLDYVLTMALDVMVRLSQAEAGGIGLVDGSTVRHIRVFGYPEKLVMDDLKVERSITRRVLAHKKPEWVIDVASDPDYMALLPDSCSQITIPLVSQDRLVGIMSLETNRRGHFTQETFEFMKLIASRIAVAIDNAQLFQITQEQVAELQSLYAQISKLEQLKTDMIRIASHDLRNPLSVAMTNAGLLNRTAGEILTDQHKHFLEQIRDATRQMQAIVSDILSLERIEEMAQDELRIKTLSLGTLVEGVVADSRVQAQTKNQTLRFSVPDADSTVVSGAETELRQAIANLIGNAIKYTPAGGVIDIMVRRQAEQAQFEVIDTGYGIPIDQQPKLFQPFFRAHTEETRWIDGTGLGLYLVKKIVERNGGTMIFRSEYGKGSTFGFRLPLSGE